MTVNRSNDGNYAALKHTSCDRRGCSLLLSFRNVTAVSLSGPYLVAIGKCLRISNIRKRRSLNACIPAMSINDDHYAQSDFGLNFTPVSSWM